MHEVENPIRRGFYPDPSICRVEDTYYCVHSTFAYAPGIPVFRSRDLNQWEQIGHVLTTKEQLRLENAPTSGGIFAPSISYHRGIFYVVVTNVTHGGNFYVTATDPAEEWSSPYYLEGAEGIDPSLFFENDRCYYVGQRTKEKAAYFGDCEIWIQELDLERHQLTGKCHVLYDGALKHANWPEGPHLYKKGAFYYLLIAEGGTEYAHSICVARSKTLYGPYESCPWNPVFTHRHLGHSYPIQNAGHGDLFSTPAETWYLLLLATRPLNGCAELGRETFLADVTWEQDWPVINAGEGKLRHYQRVEGSGTCQNETPKPPQEMKTKAPMRNLLSVDTWKQVQMELLGLRGNLLWDKKIKCYVEGQGLTVPLSCGDFTDPCVVPSYLGIRLTHRNFFMQTRMEAPEGIDRWEAGLLYYYDEKNHIRFGVVRGGDRESICVTEIKGGKEKVTSVFTERQQEYVLSIRGQEQRADFFYEDALHKKQYAAMAVDLRELCSEKAGGFTGCTIGVYGISHESATATEPTVRFLEWITA